MLAGFRVPLGCARVHDGPNAALCLLHDVAPGGALVREFLLSRYANMQTSAAGQWQVTSPTAGTMQVLMRGNVAQFLTIAREKPLLLDSTAAAR